MLNEKYFSNASFSLWPQLCLRFENQPSTLAVEVHREDFKIRVQKEKERRVKRDRECDSNFCIACAEIEYDPERNEVDRSIKCFPQSNITVELIT